MTSYKYIKSNETRYRNNGGGIIEPALLPHEVVDQILINYIKLSKNNINNQ